MALPTFAPPVGPSPGTNDKPEIDVSITQFGDGYTQETRKGLNHKRSVLTLKWEGLTKPQFLEILRFLDARGGDGAFWYQSAVCLGPKKWTCRDYSPSLDGGVYKLTATFRQSFTLQS